MKISYHEEISISGKSNNRKIYFRAAAEKSPLVILPSAHDNGITFKGGELSQRQAFKEWLKSKSPEQSLDSFDDIFKLVKSIVPPRRKRKAALWLR